MCLACFAYPTTAQSSTCGGGGSLLVYERAAALRPVLATRLSGQVLPLLQLVFLTEVQQLVFVTLELCLIFKIIKFVRILSNSDPAC